MALTLELETLFFVALNTSWIYPITSKVCFVKGLANYIKYCHMFLTSNHICPNNLPLWKSMIKPQQINEHVREVINHSTYIHLLETYVTTLCNCLIF